MDEWSGLYSEGLLKMDEVWFTYSEGLVKMDKQSGLWHSISRVPNYPPSGKHHHKKRNSPLSMVKRFCYDDPRFGDFQSDWAHHI